MDRMLYWAQEPDLTPYIHLQDYNALSLHIAATNMGCGNVARGKEMPRQGTCAIRQGGRCSFVVKRARKGRFGQNSFITQEWVRGESVLTCLRLRTSLIEIRSYDL